MASVSGALGDLNVSNSTLITALVGSILASSLANLLSLLWLSLPHLRLSNRRIIENLLLFPYPR